MSATSRICDSLSSCQCIDERARVPQGLLNPTEPGLPTSIEAASNPRPGDSGAGQDRVGTAQSNPPIWKEGPSDNDCGLNGDASFEFGAALARYYNALASPVIPP